MLAPEYHDAIRTRLKGAASTPSELRSGLAVLHEIERWLDPHSRICTKTAVDLCELLGMDKANLSRLLSQLESIGAIVRVKRGRSKLIMLTGEAVPHA